MGQLHVTRCCARIQKTKMDPFFNRCITAMEVSNATARTHLKTVPLTAGHHRGLDSEAVSRQFNVT